MKFLLGALALGFAAHVVVASGGAGLEQNPGATTSAARTRPAATPQCPNAVALGSGDRATVRTLQQALSKKGHQVATDGKYGTETLVALTVFKTKKNLDNNSNNARGIVDKPVWQALDVC